MKVRQIGLPNPARIRCIITGDRLTRYILGRQIHDDIMKSDPTVFIMLDYIEDIHRLARPNDNTGFFQYFPLGCCLKGFPQPDAATGDRPISNGRGFSTPYQKHGLVFKNHSANR